MLVYFVIATLGIFVAGPLHNEGGAKCIETKGTKECVNNALTRGEKYDYSKAND